MVLVLQPCLSPLSLSPSRSLFLLRSSGGSAMSYIHSFGSHWHIWHLPSSSLNFSWKKLNIIFLIIQSWSVRVQSESQRSEGCTSVSMSTILESLWQHLNNSFAAVLVWCVQVVLPYSVLHDGALRTRILQRLERVCPVCFYSRPSESESW